MADGEYYPLPPQEPPGGWKNDAQWIGNVEEWAREMMRLGFTPDDLARIYPMHVIGANGPEPFPKNLMNSIRANNWLFPGADMMYEYDLDNHMKRHYTYNDPANPGQQKGPFEWEPMSQDEINSLNQYFGWRDDPAHEWMIKSTIDSSGPEGNPYAAWLRQWGNYYKDENYKVPTTPGANKFSQPHDIFGPRSGFDPKSGKPVGPTTDNGPVKGAPAQPPMPSGPLGTPTAPLSASATADRKNAAYSRLTSNQGISSLSAARGFGLINNETQFARNPSMGTTGGWNQFQTPTPRRFRYN